MLTGCAGVKAINHPAPGRVRWYLVDLHDWGHDDPAVTLDLGATRAWSTRDWLTCRQRFERSSGFLVPGSSARVHAEELPGLFLEQCWTLDEENGPHSQEWF